MPIFAKGDLVDLDSFYINHTGDEMNGVLNMKGNKIINLPVPESSTDAVNKNYVDFKTRLYGFKFTANVSPQSTDFTIVIKVAGNIDPDKIMLLILRPGLNDIALSSSLQNSMETTCNFSLRFNKSINRRITVPGIIYISNDSRFSISDNDNVINIL